MKWTAEVIATGTELLQGRTLNRHGYVLGEVLTRHGVELLRETVLPDAPEAITGAVRDSLTRSRIVFVTGGLGPTDDDRTREAVAAALGLGVVHEQEADQHLESCFARLEKEPTFAQRRQAMIVEGATVWINPVGIAPGQCVELEDRVVILLPGPPAEMRGIVDRWLIPWLSDRVKTESTSMRLFRIIGLSESAVETTLLEQTKFPRDLEISYCARPGSVELRFTGIRADVDQAASAAEVIFADHILNSSGEPIEATLGEILEDRALTIATAESCTGGGIVQTLTRVPGSSSYVLGGIIAYANEVKQDQLGVRGETLAAHGAVSPETAAEMAVGVRNLLGADIGISVTGIAGPGGGTDEKPVGLFYLGIADEQGVETKRYIGGRSRAYIQDHAVQRALELVWRRVR